MCIVKLAFPPLPFNLLPPMVEQTVLWLAFSMCLIVKGDKNETVLAGEKFQELYIGLRTLIFKCLLPVWTRPKHTYKFASLAEKHVGCCTPAF